LTPFSISKCSFFAAASLPLLVVVGFLLDRQLSQSMYLLGYDPSTISHIWFLRDQHDFLEKNFGGSLNIQDLHVFELFVWLALLLFAFRFLSGMFALEFFDRVSVRLKKLKVSPLKYFFMWLFMGPLVVFASINIGRSSQAVQFEYIIQHSMRAFLCLEAFMFCGGIFFFTEGLLFFLSLIFRREREGRNKRSLTIPA
jgi:hypothetical protein